MYVILHLLVSNILHIMMQCVAFNQKLRQNRKQEKIKTALSRK